MTGAAPRARRLPAAGTAVLVPTLCQDSRDPVLTPRQPIAPVLLPPSLLTECRQLQEILLGAVSLLV